MQIMLEFDGDRGYGPVEINADMTLDTYLSMPVIRWCHTKIGPMCWPRSPNEILQGDGWEIYADWSDYLAKAEGFPKTYVVIKKHIDQQLLTDFWMRFQ